MWYSGGKLETIHEVAWSELSQPYSKYLHALDLTPHIFQKHNSFKSLCPTYISTLANIIEGDKHLCYSPRFENADYPVTYER